MSKDNNFIIVELNCHLPLCEVKDSYVEKRCLVLKLLRKALGLGVFVELKAL